MYHNGTGIDGNPTGQSSESNCFLVIDIMHADQLHTIKIQDGSTLLFLLTVQHQNKVRVRTVTRYQLPVLSAKAFTDYAIQGQTLQAGVIDLATRSFVNDNFLAATIANDDNKKKSKKTTS